MKQAFIHIGMPGAGSERIHSLLQNHDAFLAGHSCICPRAGRLRPATAMHHNLGFELLKDPRYQANAGGLDALSAGLVRRGASKVVISSNLFYGIGARAGLIESLRRPFVENGYQVSWIVYLRPYAEWLESQYIERLVAGESLGPMKQWVASNHNPNIAAPDRLIRPFFASGDRVIVRSYPQVADRMAADFLDQIGLPHPEDLVDEDPARQILLLEFRRLVRKFGEMHLDATGKERLHARARQSESRLPRSATIRMLDAATAAELETQTQASYEAVLQLAGIHESYAEFFPAREDFRFRDFSNSQVPAEFLASFYKNYLACTLA
jgi:hypothetical protein